MDWMTLLAAVGGIAVAQSIFLGAINMINSRQSGQANFYLGLLFLALGLRVAKSLIYYHWTGMAMVGISVGGAGLWAAAPALFLYIKTFAGRSVTRFEKYGLFAPALFLLIAGISELPFYRARMVYLTGSIALLLSLAASVYLLTKWRTVDKNGWLRIVLAGVFVIASTFIYQLFSPNLEIYAIGALVASVVLYIINFKGIGSKVVSTSVQSSKISLSKNQLDKITSDLQKALKEGRVYREQKLTLARLAERIDTPQYLLRKVIQQNHGKNFNDFINEYRITEICERLEKDTRYTIEAIASEVGFSSNSTFYEAFRKVMNCTPAEYRKRLQNGEMPTQNTGLRSVTSGMPA
ncbi:MAG TPA: helix-turn-helix domain-containing protein [Cyclobacteriaceae bacterium]|nr:helix-turn-helix domain-containing protein [Cyclobacteriaceae bacterium]